MAEAEATIPNNSASIPEKSEKSETTLEKSETIVPKNAQGSTEAPVPTSKRGRPAGSKDRAPRRKVNVEPIPVPVEEERQQAALDAPPPTPPPVAKPKAAPTPQRVVRESRPPSPEPPSPRTLYRETSAHLATLRDLMHDQRLAKVADRYTSKLHSWGV